MIDGIAAAVGSVVHGRATAKALHSARKSIGHRPVFSAWDSAAITAGKRLHMAYPSKSRVEQRRYRVDKSSEMKARGARNGCCNDAERLRVREIYFCRAPSSSVSGSVASDCRENSNPDTI